MRQPFSLDKICYCMRISNCLIWLWNASRGFRAAIARGLLRPGGILLLDEPTSSLDNETEKLLLQRLSGHLQGKTLILVSHRETIARLCTEVVRFGG